MDSSAMLVSKIGVSHTVSLAPIDTSSPLGAIAEFKKNAKTLAGSDQD
jgi:hypothetical protein